MTSTSNQLARRCDDLYAKLQQYRVPANSNTQVSSTHHQSYLLGRIQSLGIIIDRLLTANDKVIELDRQISSVECVVGPSADTPELRRLHRETHRLETAMRLDMESLFIFSNMALDQWALFYKNELGLSGNKGAWQHPFSELARRVTNSPQSALQQLRDDSAPDIWWLMLNVRSYRNNFVEHLERPWQRGISRYIYHPGMTFFIPASVGVISDADQVAEVQALSHLIPESLQREINERPRLGLQWLVHNVDKFERPDDRQAIAQAWGRLGGESADYHIIASRVLSFLDRNIYPLNGRAAG